LFVSFLECMKCVASLSAKVANVRDNRK